MRNRLIAAVTAGVMMFSLTSCEEVHDSVDTGADILLGTAMGEGLSHGVDTMPDISETETNSADTGLSNKLSVLASIDRDKTSEKSTSTDEDVPETGTVSETSVEIETTEPVVETEPIIDTPPATVSEVPIEPPETGMTASEPAETEEPEETTEAEEPVVSEDSFYSIMHDLISLHDSSFDITLTTEEVDYGDRATFRLVGTTQEGGSLSCSIWMTADMPYAEVYTNGEVLLTDIIVVDSKFYFNIKQLSDTMYELTGDADIGIFEPEVLLEDYVYMPIGDSEAIYSIDMDLEKTLLAADIIYGKVWGMLEGTLAGTAVSPVGVTEDNTYYVNLSKDKIPAIFRELSNRITDNDLMTLTEDVLDALIGVSDELDMDLEEIRREITVENLRELLDYNYIRDELEYAEDFNLRATVKRVDAGYYLTFWCDINEAGTIELTASISSGSSGRIVAPASAISYDDLYDRYWEKWEGEVTVYDIEEHSGYPYCN